MGYSVGEVELYDLFANLPAAGVTGKVYSAADTNVFYTWNGSAYVSFPVVGAPRVVSVASSATPSINVAVTDLYELTALAVAITGVTVTGTPSDGQNLDVRIKGTGSRAITWGASFLGSGVQALLTTTATTKTHLNRFKWDSVAAAFVCWYVDATGY